MAGLANGRSPEVQAALALQLASDLRDDLREIKGTLEKIETRMRRIENWRAYALGAAAATGAGVSFLVKLVR